MEDLGSTIQVKGLASSQELGALRRAVYHVLFPHASAL